MFASRFSVLEPVKDVCVTNLTVFLQLGSDLSYLVPRRVDHPGVEDGFQYAYLFWFRVPSWFRFGTSFFTSGYCLEEDRVR